MLHLYHTRGWAVQIRHLQDWNFSFFQLSLPIEYRRGRLGTPVDKTNPVSDLRAMIGDRKAPSR
jgi:hypothetical protein